MELTLLGGAFLAGFLSFISPCVLPLLPTFSLILAKNSQQDGGEARRLYANTTAFLAGFTLVFVMLGATASLIGSWLFSYQEMLRQGALLREPARAGGVEVQMDAVVLLAGTARQRRARLHPPLPARRRRRLARQNRLHAPARPASFGRHWRHELHRRPARARPALATTPTGMTPCTTNRC